MLQPIRKAFLAFTAELHSDFVARIIEGLRSSPESLIINELIGMHGQVWTQESFAHVVRHDAESEEKIDYVRQNAVRKGLVTSAKEYRWLYERDDEI